MSALAEWMLRATGGSMALLALLHVGFAKRFQWKEETARMSMLNQQIFYVHCFFICLVLLMMAALLGIWPHLLLEGGPLARIVASGGAIFWFARLYIQWAYYDARLWRGKAFETMVHTIFTLLWCWYAVLFTWVAWHA